MFMLMTFFLLALKNSKVPLYQTLREIFSIGKEENNQFKYLRVNLQNSNNKISVDQNEYIESLKKINLEPYTKENLNKCISADKKDILR